MLSQEQITFINGNLEESLKNRGVPRREGLISTAQSLKNMGNNEFKNSCGHGLGCADVTLY